MSTLGSEFNTLSGVLTRDFFKKKIKPGLTEKQEIFTGRTFTVLIGAVTVSLAILFNALQGFNLMDIMFRVFSAFGAGHHDPAHLRPALQEVQRPGGDLGRDRRAASRASSWSWPTSSWSRSTPRR